MRRAFAFLARGAAAAALLAIPSCSKPRPAAANGPEKLLVPEKGAYTGAFMDFGDTEDDVTLENIEAFENLVGKHQAIIASSSYWGEQSFPTANMELIWRHGSVPLLFWSPWDRPYDEDQGPDKFSLSNIAAGKWDAYIDHWADAAKAFGHPIMVSFANEMNGQWFPWSGMFFGGDKQLPNTDTPKYTGPQYEMNADWFPWCGMFCPERKEGTKTKPPRYVGTDCLRPVIERLLSAVGNDLQDSADPDFLAGAHRAWWLDLGYPRYLAPEVFKAAYRRVVDRVRARGASNIIWVFHFMNYSMPQEEWNLILNYYPGPKYVDWLGMSVYGQQYVEDNWSPFEPLLDWPYQEITTIEPHKPVMLAEWGIGEFPQFGSKSEFIKDAFKLMKKYPHLKAAVFWNERWQNEPSQNPDGTYQDGSYSNLRVNSSPDALAAYQQGVGGRHWLGTPIIGH
jgi:beta-mannanase